MQKQNIKRTLNIIFKFAIIDIRRRFRSSILSWFWLFLGPLLMLFMYWFAFSSAGEQVDTVEFSGVKYKWIAWVIIGVFSWSYFGDVVVSSPSAIRNYHWMPKSFGIHYAIPSVIVNVSRFTQGLFLMIAAWIITIICNAVDNNPDTHPVTWYSLEVPIVFLLMFLFIMAYSYFLTPFVAISRDIQNLIIIIPMLLAWVSGVFLQPTTVDTPVNIILKINPFYFLINGLRSTMMGYGELFSQNVYADWYSPVSFFLFTIAFASAGFIFNYKSKRFIMDIV